MDLILFKKFIKGREISREVTPRERERGKSVSVKEAEGKSQAWVERF